ncbi:hypothetical protein MKX01_030121 [Papaver californicum]|nr:hypothetical protein MKX01_030121 [Papaver californicum]
MIYTASGLYKRRRISSVTVDVNRALVECLPEDRFCIERKEDRYFPSKQISHHHYESKNKQLRLFANHEYNKEMMFWYSMGKENDHPPLYLCLSFM